MNQLLTQVLSQIGTATVVIAILGFGGKQIFAHLLKAHLEELKSELKHKSEVLLAQHKKALDIKAATDERIRREVVRWANPIFNSVKDLQCRLNNILEDEGYKALDPATASTDSQWSMTYEYFMESTLYLFGQYFCWVHMLTQELSLELFHTSADKERFAAARYAVSGALGDYPPSFPVHGTGYDRQVFHFQQRAIDEMLSVSHKGSRSCVAFPKYATKRSEAEFTVAFDPLRQLLDKVKPGERRWERFCATREALINLFSACETLLKLDA